MVERLLLDRVHAEAAGAAIGSQDHLVAVPRAHEAQALLPLAQPTVARAEIALDAAVVKSVPVLAGYHGDSPGFVVDSRNCTRRMRGGCGGTAGPRAG